MPIDSLSAESRAASYPEATVRHGTVVFGRERRGKTGFMRFLGYAWIVARRAVAEAREDRVTMTAHAIAYSLFLAIPASRFVLIGDFSLVADESLIEDLVARARTVMPEEAMTLLCASLRRTSESSGSGILLTLLGFALALRTTTSAATTLMRD